MKTRLMTRKTLLALSATAALAACGGGGGDAVVPSPSVSPTPVPAGPTPVPLQLTLCRDVNLDGKCSAGEQSRKITSYGQAVTQGMPAGTAPFLVVDDTNKIKLTAAGDAGKVDMLTSLIYNEMMVNPASNGTKAGALAYLKSRFKVQGDKLSDADSKALQASLKKALAAHPDKSPYAVIAAVVDKAAVAKSFAGVSVNAADIEKQGGFAAAFEQAPTAETLASWTVTDHDERVHGIRAQGDDVVAWNYWHNGIVKVPAASKNAQPELVNFAAFMTSGHNVDSSNADYVSGASEHRLQDVWYSDDGKAMYALVRQPGGNVVAGDDTFGLFRVPVGADGKIASQDIKGHKVYHRSNGVTRIADANVAQAMPLPDGRVLAYDSKNKAVRVYSDKLVLDTAGSFPLPNEIEDWKSDGSFVYILEKDSDDVVTLTKRDLKDLKTVVKSVVFEKEQEPEVLAVNSKSQFIAVGGEVEDSEGNESGLLYIYDRDLNRVRSVAVGNEVEELSISNDGRRLAVLEDDSSEVKLLDLDKPLAGALKLDLGRSPRAITLVDADTLVFSKESGKVERIDLKKVTVQGQTPERVVDAALAGVKAETINNGYAADAVIWDLSLPGKLESVPGAALDWRSTDNAIADAKTGKITQPAVGQPGASVTLTVKATARFRDEEKVAEKSYDLTVRAKTEEKKVKLLNLPEKLSKLSYEWASANDSGTRFVIYDTPSSRAKTKGGFAVFERDGEPSAEKSGLKLVSSPDKLIDFGDALKTYRVYRTAWQGDNVLLALIGDTSSDNRGNGKIMKWDFSQATPSWQEVKSFNMPVVGGQTDGKRNILNIMLRKDDKNYMATYRVSDLSELIAPAATEQGSRYYSVSADGKVTYLRENGKLAKYVYDGAAYKKVSDFGIFTRMYYSIVQDGNFYGIDAGSETNGLLSIIPDDTNPINPASVNTYSTARGSYTDGKRHSFYVATLEKAGNTLIGSHNGTGVVALDVSDPKNVREKFTVNLPNTYRIDASGNGDYVFIYNRYNRREAGSVDGVALIKLTP